MPPLMLLAVIWCLVMGEAWGTPSRVQDPAVVSGYVRDVASGEAISGATVYFYASDTDRPYQTVSNDYGFYSLALPKGVYRIAFTRVGYLLETMTGDRSDALLSDTLSLTHDTIRHAGMRSAGELEEVVVSVRRGGDQLQNPLMGLSRVDVTEIQQVPVLLGEKDVLKTIQLLPGVLSGGEGSSQFFVRGGMGDQNLILLDGATVFNASHLFGFFSTFNSDAIRDVDLYKGGMPAQYGGRLSSVLDIRMDEGNNQKFHAEGGIGLIASRLKLEGPIVRDRASFMVSGRRTYADLFLKLSSDPDISQSSLYFYDLNLKTNYRFNDRNTLFLSGYFGQDILGYADQFRFGWGNSSGTLRWNHLWTNQLFSNTTVVYSDYHYRVDLLDENIDFVIAASIRGAQAKQDFQYYAGDGHQLRFGVDLKRQEIHPTHIDAGENASVNSLDIEKQRGDELAAYVSHEWNVSPAFSMVYGMRMQNFWLRDSPQAAYQAQHYLTWEPRFSASYLLNDAASFKAAYSRNSQLLHQLTNTTSSLPTDAWILSSERVKPQLSDQYSLGFYRNFDQNLYEFSVEAYYKDMYNQIDYRDAANLQANAYVEDELVFGIGRSYGIEWYLKKQRGRWNGWIACTWSKSERRFDDINQGNWFHARQDRTHDLSSVLMVDLSPAWSISATFVYATGHAVTWPSGKYQVNDQVLFYYTERNAYRMPDYHRLDVGLTWEPSLKKGFNSSWTFGIYNAYNRKNAYIIDFRESETHAGRTDVYRIALFGAIPAVSWNFKW